MKEYLKIFFLYFLFWLVFFIFSKFLFLIYNYPLSKEFSFITWLLIIYHGFILDLSISGYIMAIPSIMMVFVPVTGNSPFRRFLNIYTLIVLVITTVLVVSDLELYRNWGFRMDSTPLLYLKTPGEAFASVTDAVIIGLTGMITAIVFMFSYLYFKLISGRIKALKKAGWKLSPIFVLLTALLFLPIRGGVGIAPANTGMVYFHEKTFPNHAAVNVVFNVAYSLLELENEPKIQYMNPQKAEKIFNELSRESGITKKVLNTAKPNIIIIILESFTSKIIGVLGGRQDVTPNINRLTKEGILFSNFYASGDRSDKGIVSIISGFPSQPTNSIIKFPQKTQRLPFLSKELEKAGYYAAFYYGGEINFANLNSYFVNGNFSTVVSKRDFDPSEYNSKWGVHDHVVFKRFFDDICKSREPFFKLMFTLSSHEPFDVPMKTAIPGSDEESMFLNSAFYTDKCIGEFIENAKKESWWKNSLVILVSDHGSRLPGNSAPSAINKFRIPMLWLGGALAVKDTVIGCCGSQTDIPHTILNQLEFQHTPFKFSRDLLAGSPNCYALYCFNNGFGFMTPETKIIFDNAARKYIMKSGKNPDNALMEGKAYLQVVEDEFNKYGSR